MHKMKNAKKKINVQLSELSMKLHGIYIFVFDFPPIIIIEKFIPVVDCVGSSFISFSQSISLCDYNTLTYLYYCWVEIYVFPV